MGQTPSKTDATAEESIGGEGEGASALYVPSSKHVDKVIGVVGEGRHGTRR